MTLIKSEVPFFRPELTTNEIAEVVDTLRSGWLTTGPKVRRFEQDFARAVGGRHAVALNSCTAALHLALEALNVKPGQAVLVPAMTFAATAEVVAYLRAVPVLVDCDPRTGNMDMADAERRAALVREGRLPRIPTATRDVVGVIPVHVGGLMMDVAAAKRIASRNGWWMVEDAAHAFPASRKEGPEQIWKRCGEGTAAVTCFSFYANKTITTGEGGMAVTDDEEIAARMRLMSLHGLSHDAWDRYSAHGKWDYQIVAPGFKYNMTDVAAALGIHQLARAEDMRRRREEIAAQYLQAFADLEEIELPLVDADCVHSWHLFSIALHLDRLSIGRNAFIEKLQSLGVKCSVHWRPLHMHPYYQEVFGYVADDLPVAAARFERILSLPLFPGLTPEEIETVISSVRDVAIAHRR
jgi:perosamine synthetase